MKTLEKDFKIGKSHPFKEGSTTTWEEYGAAVWNLFKELRLKFRTTHSSEHSLLKAMTRDFNWWDATVLIVSISAQIATAAATAGESLFVLLLKAVSVILTFAHDLTVIGRDHCYPWQSRADGQLVGVSFEQTNENNRVLSLVDDWMLSAAPGVAAGMLPMSLAV